MSLCLERGGEGNPTSEPCNTGIWAARAGVGAGAPGADDARAHNAAEPPSHTNGRPTTRRGRGRRRGGAVPGGDAENAVFTAGPKSP